MSPCSPKEARARIAWAISALLIGLLALIAVGARDLEPFAGLEGRLLDARFRLRGPLTPTPDVALVMIDDATVEKAGRWPVQHDLLARALDRLAADGASVVAVDLLLLEREDEADPVSGVAAPGRGDRLAAAFAAAAPTAVAIAVAFGFEGVPSRPLELPADLDSSTFPLVRQTSSTPGALPSPSTLAAPEPELLRQAAAGHANVFLEADGSLRFVHAALGPEGRLLPFLPVEAVRLHLGVERSDMALDLGRTLAIGSQRHPVDEAGRLAVNFLGPRDRFPRHPLIDVAEGRLPAGTFVGKIVVVGADVVGAHDRFATPYTPGLPGAELFATVIDNLLEGRVLRRTPGTVAVDLAAILLLGVLAARLTQTLAPAPAALAVLGLLGLWCAAAQIAFVRWHLWLNAALPLAAVAGAGLIHTVARLRRDDRRRRIAEAGRVRLARYVSPLVQRLADDGGGVARAARQLDVVVLFVDMQGSTALGETAGPDEMLAIMRRLHRRIERVVAAEGGAVDKYHGDGAMCLFGVPDPGPDDARAALRAALALAETRIETSGGASAVIRVGLHKGPVAFGEVGGEQGAQLTAMGDTVNVASRLEALTRTVDTPVLASEAVIAAARAAGGGAELDGFVPLGPVEIRGRREPLAIWAWRPVVEMPATAPRSRSGPTFSA